LKLTFFFDFYVLVKFAVLFGFLSTLLQAIIVSGGAYQDAARGGSKCHGISEKHETPLDKEIGVALTTEENLRLCVNKPCWLLAIGYTCIS
jgi:hypothetical protein